MAQKFSNDAPEKGLETRERHKKHKKGILLEREATLGASSAPRASYTQEYWDANGNLVKFMAPLIPLYLTSDILDAEFLNYIGGFTYLPPLRCKVEGDGGVIVDAPAGDGNTVSIVPPHNKAILKLEVEI